MHTFTHSVGLYVVDRALLPVELAEEDKDGNLTPNVSFVIHEDGEVEEVMGWGANTGRFPGRTAGDDDVRNVTTVVVEDSEAARESLSELARDHVDRYREGRLIAYPETGPVDSLGWWIKAGMPVDHGDEDGEETEGLRDLERLPTPLSSAPKHVAQMESQTKRPSGIVTDADLVDDIRENQVEADGIGIPTGGAGTPEELVTFEREAREESGAEHDPQTARAIEDTERREQERAIEDVIDDPVRIDSVEADGPAPEVPKTAAKTAAEKKVEAAKAKKDATKTSSAKK